MCTHQKLTQGINGFIVYCLKCNHYQLAFGTSVINMNMYQFEEFCYVAHEQLLENSQNHFPKNKTITLPTFAINNQMVLCYLELKQLIDMINEATIMIETYRLINTPIVNRPRSKDNYK